MAYKPGDYDKYGRLVQEDGTVLIPGTRRPDGTMRKDTRVKPDYMPLDELAKYESKGSKIARERKEAGIPGLGASAAKAEPKLSKNQKKNIRKKQQKEAGDGGADEADLASALAGASLAESAAATQPDWLPGTAPAAATSAEPADVPVEKKIKALQKKIRQTEELEQKVASGALTPSAEQQEKLLRLNQLRQELAALTAAAP